MAAAAVVVHDGAERVPIWFGAVELRYWRRAAHSLVRHLRDREFAGAWLAAGLQADEAPRARRVHVFDAYPELAGQVVSMGEVVFRPFNLDPTERFVLAALAALRRPRRIFEFGTYDGATTLLLAQAAPDAEVVTLDLPPAMVEHVGGPVADHLGAAGGAGARFRDRAEGTRVTQLHADSRRFDAADYAGSVDLVLVDGGHQYDCVAADSENALHMLGSAGVVFWDDYSPAWPDVVRAVDDVARRHGIEVLHLAPTDLAVYDAGRPGAPLPGAAR